MGATKDIFALCIELRGENNDKRADEATGKIETQALAPQSEQDTIKKKRAERLTEIIGLKRNLAVMEISHTQAMAAVQEEHRAAQEKYDAEMAKISANIPKRTDELTLKTLKIECDPQRKRSNQD
jgi:hypothetical protein